jgi:anti-sigma factor RsiW
MTYEPGDLFLENIPAYALGALDAEESLALEAHLQTCQSCQAELGHRRRLARTCLGNPPQPPSAAPAQAFAARLPSAQKPPAALFLVAWPA